MLSFFDCEKKAVGRLFCTEIPGALCFYVAQNWFKCLNERPVLNVRATSLMIHNNQSAWPVSSGGGNSLQMGFQLLLQYAQLDYGLNEPGCS